MDSVAESMPCVKCGSVEPRLLGGRCRTCARAYQKAWRDKHRIRLNAKLREDDRLKRKSKFTKETGLPELPPWHQQCFRCRKIKVLSEFYRRKSDRKHRQTRRSWCKDCDRRDNRKELSPRRATIKNWKLKKRFGITLAQYDEMVAKQGGLCAICGKPPSARSIHSSLCVDHDHESGRVRGLLCGDCNIGIGKLGDNLEGVMRAVKYLQLHDKTRS